MRVVFTRFWTDLFYERTTVNYREEIDAQGERHVNTRECEFSLMSPFLMVHRRVAKYNLPLYLGLYGLHRQVSEWEVEEALGYLLGYLMVGIIFCVFAF